MTELQETRPSAMTHICKMFPFKLSGPCGWRMVFMSFNQHCIPANSHALGVSLTPVGWKLRSHACGPISHAWLKNVSYCCLAWHNFQKYVNSDPCKERKPCVKWINDNTFLAISDFWSEKHWERACVYTGTGTSDTFRRLRDSPEDCGLHRESSEMIVSSS